MKVTSQGRDYSYELAGVAMLFLPTEKVSAYTGEVAEGDYISAKTAVNGNTANLSLEMKLHGESYSSEKSISVPSDSEKMDKSCETALAVMLYRLLQRLTGKTPKWGILTGIRPVKLIQRRLDMGISPQEIRREFKEEFLVSDEKLNLAFTTRETEHMILSRSTMASYSLYISIPFCPSRCLYCSFVSHSIQKTYKLIDEYVEKLCREIRITAKLAEDCKMKLRTVYFGGGTPTSITAEQLKTLTDCVAECFDLSELWEYTIEAGRPDTITREKLEVIKAAGVTRISINPQTFSDEVLAFVGRKHSAEAVVDCYNMARELGFDNINMDIIAGLPTDTLDSFKHTVERLIELFPENITVHTLSVKRSAELAQNGENDLADQVRQVSDMVDYSQKRLMESGYIPYYLYRQRNILDNLENTGYCKAGKEGLYNVYIMDETHTILACGAGAVSKLRQPNGEDIQRIFNFKYPYEYIGRFDELMARKKAVTEFYEKYPLA